MDFERKKNAAEEVRKAVRKKRLERSRYSEEPTLPPPLAEYTLGPIPGDDRTLWPTNQWGNDLKFTPSDTTGMEFGLGEYLVLLLNGIEVAKNLLGDLSDTVITATADKFSEPGTYTFSYIHINLFGNPARSFDLVITVDQVAPNLNLIGEMHTLPIEVVDHGLTLKYLDDNPYLYIIVPRTSDILAGDTLSISWVPSVVTSRQSEPFEPIVTKVLTEAEADPTTGPLLVGIDSELIKALPQGKIAVYYRYVDRAGNLGQFSRPVYITVDLTPGPANLKTPIVDLALDGNIDRTDAQFGVEFEIPSPIYDNAQLGKDLIEVIWEGTALERRTVTEFPMIIPIEWETLSAKGASDERTFFVSYNVVRDESITPSPTLEVTVNFTMAGPPTDELGPINSNLLPVVVQSRDGLPPPNQLRAIDVGEPAVVQLKLYNEVEAGQELELHWGALVKSLTITGQLPGENIQFLVTWDEIKEEGYNERLPVYYTTWNGINLLESVRTEVSVTIIPMDGLIDVEFPDRWMENTGLYPIINCGSKPWEGIDIVMYGAGAGMQAGDTVTFSWEAFSDLHGNLPIPDTAHTFDTITVTPEHVSSGLAFTIPYEDRVEPIVTHGSGRVTYVLSKISEQQGSHSTHVWISRRAGSGWCDASSSRACMSGKKEGLAGADGVFSRR
ncbi:hypothetical protein RYB01_27205 [Pseudomonas syringae]|nr:hypothetical protein [Pseudomonas syringae]